MVARHGQLTNAALKVSDLVLMFAALSFAIVVNYAPETSNSVQAYAVDFLHTRVKVGNALLCALMVTVWYILFNIQGVYRSHRLSTFFEELREIGAAVALASFTLLMFAQIGRWPTVTLWTACCVGIFGFAL